MDKLNGHILAAFQIYTFFWILLCRILIENLDIQLIAECQIIYENLKDSIDKLRQFRCVKNFVEISLTKAEEERGNHHRLIKL